jgi:hypothetical protein
MGEAKRRGTYEERLAAAIARKEKEASVKREILARRPSPKLSKNTAVIATLLAIGALSASRGI